MTNLEPMGDQAALARFEREEDALRFAAAARAASPPWLLDVVQAYATVAVFFDPGQTVFAQVAAAMEEVSRAAEGSALEPGRLHIIPCCYEMGPDLARVAEHTGLTAEEVIGLHAGTEYIVYAIGFCPGFPYLGYLPERLCGVPRLPSPRLRVEAGSVGLTGRQTGIYTEPRPGGWNLIGRTPLELVNVAEGYFPLRTGDRVRFTRIDAGEYRRLLGGRPRVAQEAVSARESGRLHPGL
jgi:inhibitor of KinA